MLSTFVTLVLVFAFLWEQIEIGFFFCFYTYTRRPLTVHSVL